MKANKSQKQRLWASCKARGLDNEAIRDLISEATGNRTDRSSEMNSSEINSLISDVNNFGETKANKMRKKFLALSHKLGWQKIKSNGVKPDMERIDSWCKNYGKFGKPLNRHTYKELCELVSQFEKVYASYL